MAEVSMSLQELREVERERDIAIEKSKELEGVVLNLKEEVVKIHASKQIVEKTVVRHTLHTYSVNKDRVRSNVQNIIESSRQVSGKNRLLGDIAQYVIDELSGSLIENTAHGYHNPQYNFSLHPAVEKHIGEMRCQNEDGEAIIRYINFEDIQLDLRKAAEEVVAQELGELRVKARNQSTRIKEILSEHQDELINQAKGHGKEIAELKDRLVQQKNQDNKAYDELSQKYDDLLNDRDTRTTEEKLRKEIKDLQQELEYQRSMPWWKRIFS